MYHVIDKVGRCPLVDKIVVASPHPLDVPDGVDNFVFWGDENDLLGRYKACLDKYPSDYVVRVTSDCPLWDPLVGEATIYNSFMEGVAYGANVIKLSFPDGLDTEVFSDTMLKFLDSSVKSKYHREHVGTIIRENPDMWEMFDVLSVENDQDFSKIKISIDTPEDLERTKSYV